MQPGRGPQHRLRFILAAAGAWAGILFYPRQKRDLCTARRPSPSAGLAPLKGLRGFRGRLGSRAGGAETGRLGATGRDLDAGRIPPFETRNLQHLHSWIAPKSKAALVCNRASGGPGANT